LKNKVNMMLVRGDDSFVLGKQEGLTCVCCYMVCKNNEFNPKSQSEWACFFGISDSTFDKLYKELKETSVIPTLPQPPLKNGMKEEKNILS
ncbi:MAG: cyclin family protein, partial [Atribacterota bacterium]|nr:cyclin family protein [Atribacterota bacterium]